MITKQRSFQVSASSSTGQVRELNQDAWSVNRDIDIFILADGIGGHRAGEVASKKAVDYFEQCSLNRFKDIKCAIEKIKVVSDIYVSIFKETNDYIYQLSSMCSDLNGMGTTLCFLQLLGSQCIFGHVGDSRIYRFRDEELTQLTRDHSLQKKVSFAETKPSIHGRFFFKNVITRFIGVDEHIEPFISFSDIQTGDVFLLCSDGLTDLVPDAKIGYLIQKFENDMDRLSKALVYAANSLGGHDNITVITTQVVD